MIITKHYEETSLKGIIEFARAEQDRKVAVCMGKLNKKHGIALRNDNEFLEKEYGAKGCYLGTLKGTPFSVNYARFSPAPLYGDSSIRALHHHVEISGIDFQDKKCIEALVKHPYIAQVAKIYGENKTLQKLLTEPIKDSCETLESMPKE